MDKKRIAVIVIFIVITIGIGYALYRVFFAPEPTIPVVVEPVIAPSEELPTSGELEGVDRPIVSVPGVLPDIGVVPGVTPEEGVLPPPTSEIIARPIQTAIVSPTKDLTGNARFYSKTDGKFYRLTRAGATELSDQVFFGVENVNWSPTKNESIIEYPDGANIYYNFDTKQQVTLPKHWQEFSFSPEGDKIAAKSMGISPDNQWLITSDPTGNNVELIEPMGANADKVIVDWSPNKHVVALSRTGNVEGGERQEILLIGQHGENFKSLTVEGRGLETKWSPGGTKLLHSVYSSRSNFLPELWIVNASGDNIGSGRKLLNLNTWASKCDFLDDRFVYCAVPITLETGAGFAPEVANTIRHQLYRIDTQTGANIRIPLDESHVIDSVFVDKDGQSVYFTDVDAAGLFQVPI